MDKRDSEKMIQLAREGKQISKILEEDFPLYDYWEIYCEVYGAGEISALGAKRMISNRLGLLATASKSEQKEIIEEINDLVWRLYTRHKENQQKLDEIRGVINRG
jgi:hypothetical protein